MNIRYYPLRRFFAFLLCLTLFAGLPAQTVQAAPYWPEGVSIEAEGGIVIDANTGVILAGKNIHTAYFPASITKILTALIVIETCEPDEVVTYSHNAVYNVESGSSNAGLDEGDRLTVLDSLYAMLLRSANEAANALAEHVAGTTEDFALLMNEKAESLGCIDSHFNNPSGLNDPEHYTSAHDMALIAQAAFENERFVEIDSTLYYDLPVTKRNPDGLRIYPGHRMLKKNTSSYYPGIIGGKTGYTSLAGNTLVTCAERDGLKLISVILNGHQTHYTDTKALLDFGFENFQSVPAADFDTTYTSIENDMMIAGLPTTDLSVLELQQDCRVTLPIEADYDDIISDISYDQKDDAPDGAIAQISYTYGNRDIGSTWLLVNLNSPEAFVPIPDVADTQEALAQGNAIAADTQGSNGSLSSGSTETTSSSDTSANPGNGNASSTPVTESASTDVSRTSGILRTLLKIILLLAVLAAAFFAAVTFRSYRRQKEAEDRENRYFRRQQRLRDMGVSEEEFDQLLQQRRSSSASASPRKKRPGR